MLNFILINFEGGSFVEKKNVKILILLVVVGIIYIGVVYFLFGGNRGNNGTIIVSSLGGYVCKNGNCDYVTVNQMNTDSKDFEVYKKNQFVGSYQLSYLKSWNFMQNGQWIQFYGDFLAVESSLHSEILDFRYEDMNESDISDIRSFISIDNISNLDTNQVIVLDIDQNGKEDRIGVFSNQIEESDSATYFSLVYLNLNGKLIEIFKDTSSKKYSLPFYNVFAILKLNEEKNPRIIINQGYYDNMGENSITMFQLDGKKINVVVKNSLD